MNNGKPQLTNQLSSFTTAVNSKPMKSDVTSIRPNSTNQVSKQEKAVNNAANQKLTSNGTLPSRASNQNSSTNEALLESKSTNQKSSRIEYLQMSHTQPVHSGFKQPVHSGLSANGNLHDPPEKLGMY